MSTFCFHTTLLCHGMVNGLVMNKGNVLRVMDKNEPMQMKCWIKLIIFKVELMGKVNKGREADKGGHKDSRKNCCWNMNFFYTLESKWNHLRWIEPSKVKSILCKCVNVNPNYRTSHESLMNRGLGGGGWGKGEGHWNKVKNCSGKWEKEKLKSDPTVHPFWEEM